ncbi:MAG: hypothetical protein OEY09_08085 [Gammaproteobacteria bacterium]|nr:hypothetical protein [Gammaproteobacteria bacterium]
MSMDFRLKQLQIFLSQLSNVHQQSVVDYAGFLVDQYKLEAVTSVDSEPEDIERPSEETVIGAIKRLKQTYYMLDTDTLLNQTSALMGQHLLQGREAVSVIDDLQALFQTQYEEFRQQ